MEIVISSLIAPLRMPHCTVPPLSDAVTFSMVMMDGFGPKVLSGDMILSIPLFRVCPKEPEVPMKPGRPESIHQRSDDVPASVQENVKLSPEHARSLARRRVTGEGRKKTYLDLGIFSKASTQK